MAISSYAAAVLLAFVSLLPILHLTEAKVGVCNGLNGNNLPSRQDTVNLYKSNNIGLMRLYHPDHATLQALRGTNIGLMIGVPNDMIQSIGSNPSAARQWIQTNIAPYASSVKFKYIVVGNEIDVQRESATANAVLPAMKNIKKALQDANLNGPKVSLAVHSGILKDTFPPSRSVFNNQGYMTPIVNFLKANGSPLLTNIYPYFSYIGNQNQIDIRYALFDNGAPIVTDSGNGLKYHNLFDALVDSFVASLEKVGASSVGIVVSESGWPDAGNGNIATYENARKYNRNLVAHVGRGTPKRPGALETYLFAMYDENLKRGAATEQHFGVFRLNKAQKYGLNFS